jgi:hypothetical protein
MKMEDQNEIPKSTVRGVFLGRMSDAELERALQETWRGNTLDGLEVHRVLNAERMRRRRRLSSRLKRAWSRFLDFLCGF